MMKDLLFSICRFRILIFLLINYYESTDDNSQTKVLNEVSNHLDTTELNQSTEFIWDEDFDVIIHTEVDFSESQIYHQNTHHGQQM